MLSRPSPTPDAQATVNPFTHLLPHLLLLVSLSDLLGLTWNSLQIWLDLESSSNYSTHLGMFVRAFQGRVTWRGNFHPECVLTPSHGLFTKTGRGKTNLAACLHSLFSASGTWWQELLHCAQTYSSIPWWTEPRETTYQDNISSHMFWLPLINQMEKR